jgi:hypothetical protein
MFYFVDNAKGKQTSLNTKDQDEALRLVNAKNEANRQPAINLEIARASSLSPVRITSRRGPGGFPNIECPPQHCANSNYCQQYFPETHWRFLKLGHYRIVDTPVQSNA